jgi:hypothetical protein
MHLVLTAARGLYSPRIELQAINALSEMRSELSEMGSELSEMRSELSEMTWRNEMRNDRNAMRIERNEQNERIDRNWMQMTEM